MGYAEGYATGASTGGSVNPFQGILKAIGESQARRYAEDKKRREEEAQLTGELLKVATQKEYELEIKKQEALMKGEISPSVEGEEGAYRYQGLPGVSKGVSEYYKPQEQEVLDPATGIPLYTKRRRSVFQPRSSGSSLADESYDQIGGGDIRSEYNRLRSQGISAEEAKRQLGIR